MAELHLAFLGPPQIVHPVLGDLTLPKRKVLALLAYLAVESRAAHSRETLLGLLWPEMPDAEARNNLRVTWAMLRERLSDDASTSTPLLHSTRLELQFNRNGNASLDVDDFHALVDACHAHAHERRDGCPECQARLARAVDLYRGQFLDGFFLEGCPAFEEWLFVQRERLHVQVMELLDELAQFHENSGRADHAEAHTRHQIELDPIRESAHRRLMRLLERQGRRTAALAQFEICRKVLEQELGTPPEAETVSLYQQIKTGSSAPKTADKVETTRNLPENTTPFIGREEELAKLGERLRSGAYRVLSLVGPGGIGKTRLAIQAARDNRDQFSDGVYFVPLASVRSVSAISAAVAEALKFSFTAGSASPQEQLIERLRPLNALLVIDNVEHLIDGVDVFLDIARYAPGVVLLITSRERLDVQAEDLFQLGGLPLPDSDEMAQASRVASVRLFCDRAYRLKKSFKLTPENLPHVVRICRLVEGMPLAIELAAARIRDDDPAGLAAAIEKNLDILEITSRDVEPQHRSMLATFDVSWQLLTPEEQALFSRLSVFRGGFTLHAAESVSGASSITLTRLRYKSLVRSAGAGRYELHELLRQFAAAKLSAAPTDTSDTQQRHADYYLNLIDQHTAALRETPRKARDLLRPDLDNTRQAWAWAVKQNNWNAIDACLSGMANIYVLNGLFAEGERVYEQATKQCAAKLNDADREPVSLGVGLLDRLALQRLHVKLWVEWINFLNQQLKLERLIAIAPEAIRQAALIDEATSEARACLLLGLAHITQGDNQSALPLLERGLQRARAGNAPVIEGILLRHIGNVWRQRGELAQEENFLQQALKVQRACHNRAEELMVLTWLGANRYRMHDYEVGLDYLMQADRLNAVVGDAWRASKIEHIQGLIEAALGNYASAKERSSRVHQINIKVGDLWQVANSLAHLAAASGKLGEHDRAVSQAREALSIAEDNNLREVASDAATLLAYILIDLRQWEEARTLFAKSLQHWQTMGQAANIAETRVGLAEVAWRQGELAQARALVDEVEPFLHHHDLSGAKEPLRVYLTSYFILREYDSQRAEAVLRRAVSLLQAQAARIRSDDLRRSFLENVDAHREIIAAVEAFSQTSPSTFVESIHVSLSAD
jgi:predicted ATPase/DNA-binding SARP family transcriptional activator